MVVVKGEAGLDLVSRKFRSAADRMEGPAFLKDLADAVRADALEGFRNSTDPAGLPWRACVYRDGPPLVVSERLMRAASGGPGHYEVLGFRAVVLGVDGSVVPYAAAHQFGADQTRPERRRQKPWVFVTRDGRTVFTRKIRAYSFRIPARPFYGFGDRLAMKVTAVILSWLRRVIGGR